MLIYQPRIDVRGGAPDATEPASGKKLENVSGKTIGFIDNAKPNFDHLVDDLAQLLVDKYGAATIKKYRKRGPNIPASNAVLQELQDQCDLVITGSAE